MIIAFNICILYDQVWTTKQKVFSREDAVAKLSTDLSQLDF
jgi:hypothetical protein